MTSLMNRGWYVLGLIISDTKQENSFLFILYFCLYVLYFFVSISISVLIFLLSCWSCFFFSASVLVFLFLSDFLSFCLSVFIFYVHFFVSISIAVLIFCLSCWSCFFFCLCVSFSFPFCLSVFCLFAYVKCQVTKFVFMPVHRQRVGENLRERGRELYRKRKR